MWPSVSAELPLRFLWNETEAVSSGSWRQAVMADGGGQSGGRLRFLLFLGPHSGQEAALFP